MGENTLISITVGGTLESLNDGSITFNEHGLIDETTCGNNYYNVKINGNVYKFVISKKSSDELETPKYVGSNIMNDITIKTDNPTVPLDTQVSVEKVSSDLLEKTLDTKEYVAFDISLYSNTRETKITKLDNGKFIVSIPVPETLKDKNIKVYYVNDLGEKIEHIAKVVDGYIVFETNHFSTYALVENKVENVPNNIDVPKTFDGISTSLIFVLISMFSIIYILSYLKKESNKKM